MELVLDRVSKQYGNKIAVDRNERGGHHRGHHREMYPEKFSAWEENASEEEKFLHALRRCGNYMKHGAERRSGQFRVLSILAAAGGSAV